MYPFFIGWNKEDLEKLRLCRNRAYYKVNTKRRQHLQASLSTYLHKEWLSNYQDTGLSAKALLKVYTDFFEPDDQKVNGEVPKGAVGGRGGRGRGRGGRGASRGARGVMPIGRNQVPEGNLCCLFHILLRKEPKGFHVLKRNVQDKVQVF